MLQLPEAHVITYLATAALIYSAGIVLVAAHDATSFARPRVYVVD